MHKKVKKLFTIFLLPSFILPLSCESIIFNIAYSNNNYISIYSTQKDRQNHLLVEYLSEKRQKLAAFFFLSRFLIFISFFPDIPLRRRLDFRKEQLFSSLNLIKITIRVTRI